MYNGVQKFEVETLPTTLTQIIHLFRNICAILFDAFIKSGTEKLMSGFFKQ